MPRGRKKARLIEKPDRQGSQDSSDGCPKYKETKLSETRSNFHKFFSREVETRTSLPPPLLDCSGPDMDCEGSRDLVCDSPTMPLLTPEVPTGEFSSCSELRHFTEQEQGEEADTSSEKSEGDSGKENEESLTSGVKWRGSRGSLASRASSKTSLTSRGSRPRSGPFNQLNPINTVVINSSNIQVKESEKKSGGGGGVTTRTTRTTRQTSKNLLSQQQDNNKAQEDNKVLTDKTTTCTDQITERSGQLSLKVNTSPAARCKAPPVLEREVDLVLNTKESPMSPVKSKGPLTPQSPMSPHKIQIPDRRASLTDKLKRAISSPKNLSTKSAQKRLTQNNRATNGTLTKPIKKADKLAKAAEGSRSITEFFPIRRSERKKKSEIEKDWMEGIEARLLATDDTDLDLEVKDIPCKGRGIVTKKMFNKGDFVVEYSGEVIDIGLAKDRESMYSLDITKGCYMYYFNHRDKQYCIDATAETGRFGRLINHSCKTPNCVTKVVMLGDSPRLILVAKQVIEEGEELLYDYGDRSKESILAHPWLAL